MKKFLLGGAALIALMGGSAVATDLAAPVYKAPVYRPPPPPLVYSTWTGFYAGLELSGKWSNTDWTATCFGSGCPGGSGFAPGEHFTPDASSPRTFRPSSFRVGGYLGYNWQVTNIAVVGVEGDIAWADNTSSVAGIVGCSVIPTSCVPTHVTTTLGIDTTSLRIKGDASFRGRVGVLVTPDWLLYAAGGWAGQRVEATISCGNPLFGAGGAWCLALRSQTNSTFRNGWTVGGGLEWRFARNWFVRGEYRYADFGNWTTSFFTTQGTGVDNINTTIHVRTHIATVGLAYKFDWGTGAVVAAY